MSCYRDVLILTASKHRAVAHAFTPNELVGVDSERCVVDGVPAVGQEYVGDVVNLDCEAHWFLPFMIIFWPLGRRSVSPKLPAPYICFMGSPGSMGRYLSTPKFVGPISI
jgi:hypothetical protein